MKIHFVEWMDEVLKIALAGDVDALALKVEAPVQAVEVNPGVSAEEGRAH
jgi:metal-dependent amidase/aminoacylase/carboxypeptidase family protein